MESTLADVARAVGCSNATVSRVINNMGQVSAAMREAVLRAMKELNYVPRPSIADGNEVNETEAKAPGLIEVIYFTDMPYERLTFENSDVKIAPLTPYPAGERLSDGNWLSNSFYRLIVDGIVYEAPFWNFKPAIQLRSNLTDPQFLAEVNRPEKAGVLLVGEYSPQLEPFARACVHPLVLVDLIVGGVTPAVTFDNFSGIALAFEHLYALGHRRFGFLGGLQTVVAYKERLTAFRCKLAEHNLPLDERHVYTGSHHMAPTGEWAEELLRQPDRPTAFLSANDFMAIALLKAAHRADVSIPRELSVVGFDDVEPASLVTPALSSVRVPTFEVGRRAIQQLSVQAKLGTRRNRHGCCIRLAPDLVVRESTAAKPNK